MIPDPHPGHEEGQGHAYQVMRDALIVNGESVLHAQGKADQHRLTNDLARADAWEKMKAQRMEERTWLLKKHDFLAPENKRRGKFKEEITKALRYKKYASSTLDHRLPLNQAPQPQAPRRRPQHRSRPSLRIPDPHPGHVWYGPEHAYQVIGDAVAVNHESVLHAQGKVDQYRLTAPDMADAWEETKAQRMEEKAWLSAKHNSLAPEQRRHGRYIGDMTKALCYQQDASDTLNHQHQAPQPQRRHPQHQPPPAMPDPRPNLSR